MVPIRSPERVRIAPGLKTFFRRSPAVLLADCCLGLHATYGSRVCVSMENEEIVNGARNNLIRPQAVHMFSPDRAG